MNQDEKAKPTFEQGMTDLEKIVTEVEQGKIGLEESISKYEQGMKLAKHCRTILEQAEKRIEIITNDAKQSIPPTD